MKFYLDGSGTAYVKLAELSEEDQASIAEWKQGKLLAELDIEDQAEGLARQYYEEWKLDSKG